MKVKRAGKSCRQAPTGWARPWSIRPRPLTVKKKIAKRKKKLSVKSKPPYITGRGKTFLTTTLFKYY